MSRDPLLQPFQLGHLTLRNRIITTAHEPAYTEDGLPKERYIAYHEARARGGVAMVMTAGSASVSRDSPPAFGNVLAWRDEVVPWVRRLTDAVHAHGAAAMIQITHLGRRTRWDRGDWLPVVAPGYAREPAHRAFPKLAEDWDLDRIAEDYADAAERMAAAGMDGIELEAYGHLLDAFWSPRLNDLDAPWNGDLAARMAFPDRVIAAIRARVGPDFLIGLRFTADERVPGGITEADGLEIARRLRESGHVDFINVIRGHIDTDPALADVIPVAGMASAPHLDFAGRVRAEAGLPTFHAARIPDVATARHAISAGLLDLVGMTRAHIADPDIVAKTARGEEHRIRPCVGATYCLDRIYQGGEALCIHNAATGRELAVPHVLPKAAERRLVVVVGAGPGGLEAARAAAERGHAVTVLEAASQPGGQLRLAALNPRRRELLGIVDWRMSECEAMGVQFRFDIWAEAEDVLALDPEVVVVATGGLAHTADLEAGDEFTVTAWDVIAGDARPGRRVLVFDDAGDAVGLQAAEVLARAGAEVEVMTPDRTFAPEVMGLNLSPWLAALQPLGVRLTVAERLRAVTRKGNLLAARIGTDYGPHETAREVDQVVVNHGTRSLDELYHALKPLSVNRGAVDYRALTEGRPQPEGEGFRLWRIGDAVAARNVHAAVWDALRLMKDV
ncbi:NAD(P)-binding protein [Paracoccus sp. S-4012]|uniref:oxidoreductase n=1 Tax=Paracoccus sp. S-4012 TaxID=2665648 RepID=UPI0012B06685|nr:FAD-dependent oxidoreductase [Paracoccus sp. S-4012]MRX50145.1 NAD(P)-binding protein [Paracoccus sp. S-4012]